MHTINRFTWLRHIALLLLFSVLSGPAAWAQAAGASQLALERTLTPGTTAWITDVSGREQRARVVGVAADVLTLETDGVARSLRLTDVTRVRVRHFDSVLNGALIGAGAAVAIGLSMCRLTEPWENCRDDVGPMLRIGAVGAGIGIGIDALFRGRRTVYDARQGSASLQAMPVVGRGGGGLLVSLSF